MKKILVLCLIIGMSMSAGRMFDGWLPEAEAGDGNSLPSCQDIDGNGASNISDAVYYLQWLFRGGPEPVCPAGNGQATALPATGQTLCYDESGSFIDCENDTCPGQDGHFAMGCPTEERFADNGDGTVTDACTGLMWQKEAADVDDDGQPTDIEWCEALSYCRGLSLAGHDDWRLPNVLELQSIINYGRTDPALDPVFGLPFSIGAFWSSSTYEDDDHDYAWYVEFYDGTLDSDAKDIAFYVRAVRNP